jgi:hypothetical protein
VRHVDESVLASRVWFASIANPKKQSTVCTKLRNMPEDKLVHNSLF